MDNKPLFTKVDIIPNKYNLTIGELDSMSDDSFREYVNNLREYFVSLHKDKHPVFSTNKSLEDINENLRKFINNYSDTDVLKLSTNRKPNVLFGESGDDFELINKMLFYSTRNSNAINHWFPEIWDTKISSGKSVTDQFYNPDEFYKNVHAVIKKDRFSFNKNSGGSAFVGDFLIQCLRIVNGNQPVYNFPSMLATWIYKNKYNNDKINNTIKEFKILDTSMGWGGRMLGALALDYYLKQDGNIKLYYHGTDVNLQVHDRFSMFLDYWDKNIIKNTLDFYKSVFPAENLLDDSFFSDKFGFYDIMFTSPPYFNKEMYSDDVNQSYLTYDNNYELWREGFLKKMLENTYKLLRSGGEAWINIADVKYKGSKYHPLEEDTIRYARKAGFQYVDKYYMVFSIMVGLDKRSEESKQFNEEIHNKKETINKNTKGSNPKTKNVIVYDGKKYKYEPIFVFRK